MILYGGGAPKDGGEGETAMKKGPWTAAEDETLAAYVREDGEGNWNAVKKKTWLARCGKSCRLRWANHLRPNLRKGSFTPEEERLIIQLHSQLGNKWARMAAQLPGRTDNEIKNYWNTRLKRFQRQGLPLYPPDIPNNHQPSSPTPASSFTFQTPSQYPTLPLFNFSKPQPPSLRPKRCYNPTSYHNGHFNPVYSMKQELPSNQIPYSTSLGVYGLSNCNQSLSNCTCQLLEDVMEEAEALASRAPKRRQLMPTPVDNPRDLKTKEEDSLQDQDIADLLDWGRNEGREISNEQSSVEENLVLDDHHFALLFPVNDDDDDNNPTVSSCSWDSFC